MPHKDWCGKPCSDCPKPCALDESMPCSPDCVYLMSDGRRDLDNCEKAKCDAILKRRYRIDITEIQRGFVEVEAGSEDEAFEMHLDEYNDGNVIWTSSTISDVSVEQASEGQAVPSEHYEPDSVYQDHAGTRYTIVHKPEIHSYQMTRLQPNGVTIANSSVVFGEWIDELHYVGPRSEVYPK